MSRINSLEELKKVRASLSGITELRITGENPDRTVIAIGMATCGIAAGAKETLSTIMDEIDAKNLKNISVLATGCFGFCVLEPMVEIRIPGRDPIIYKKVDAALAKEIVDKHIASGNILTGAVFEKEVNK